MQNKEWFSVQEVAEYFGLSRRTVYRDIKAGRLPVSRIGGSSIRINRIQLQHYINAKR